MRPITPALTPAPLSTAAAGIGVARVGERHPAVQRNEAHLRAEARDEQRERRVAPRRGGQAATTSGNLGAAMRLARREHGESEQQKGLAQNGEGHIDARRPARLRSTDQTRTCP